MHEYTNTCKADNWESDWRADVRAPNGERWRFPGGSRAMIGKHACHDPRKDLVIPVFSPPQQWAASPWLRPKPPPVRTTLAYFSGNLAEKEPLKYARGVRHRLRKAFLGKPGWVLVGKRGALYSRDLSSSEFCIVPPGGDGWSSRVDDAVRHGCIPVVLMDGVRMPFEGVLDYAAFALRVPEADVERLDALLRAVPAARRAAMRAAMATLWTRFTYAKALLQPDAWLPRPDLPREYLNVPPLPALAAFVAAGVRSPPRARSPRRKLLQGTSSPAGHEAEPALGLGAFSAETHAAPDALDTIIMFLASRAGLTVRATTPQE